MATFEPGTWVWIQDEVDRFLPAKVTKAFAKGEPTRVMTEDGENRDLTAQQSAFCEPCNPEALSSTIDDLVNISDLNEMAILHNLRIRFKEDRIYTNISSIIISVNPFKQLPLYTPATLEQYKSGPRGKAPHVFAAAYNAYHNMLNESNDQSVVISGESGAGKSEATKLILQFLAEVSQKTGPDGAKSNNLESQILAANPILEAFGNAKTLRNNNSSRFGKLITVNFDKNGGIMGGGIINYLLEKSRVVFQTQGERNYHIFYQLLTLIDNEPALAAELKLQNPELFAYTNQSGVTHVDGISDDRDFEDMKNSMNILKFDPVDQKEIYRLVAGVLHFGNVKFRAEKDGSAVVNNDVLAHAAAMWQCDPANMEKFLTNKHIGTRDVILVPLPQNQAQDARDGMVKRVYGDLFQWLVDKINSELSTGGVQRHKFIGVLDIFGFESFEVNSFEQLCINFCNEKLQFHFNEHIFKMEQELYKAEGITIPGTAFVDNQPTLDLLEAKATGLFSMVDEELNVPRGSDEGFLQKVFQKHGDGKHPNLLRPKAKDCKDFLKNFGVLHYAGPVYYNVANFLEKNRDQLSADILNVLQNSQSQLMKKLFPPEEPAKEEPKAGARGGKAGGASKKTLGAQFKVQLNDLISTLNTTHPHFVRCMKSNDKKVGNIFAAQRMQDQLRCAGLVEVCRIRKMGYPVRRAFDEFFKRYRCMDLLVNDLDALIASLKKKGVLKDGEWAKGTTKIFMRTAQSSDLEIAREVSFTGLAISVQKYGRRGLAVRKYAYYKNVLKEVAAATAKRDEAELSTALDSCFELPGNGEHVEVVKKAKALLPRIREEKRVNQLFQDALATRDLNGLKSAMKIHQEMNPPFETPFAKQAADIFARLEEEAVVKTALTKACEQRDRAKLEELLGKAKGLDLQCNEVNQAQAVIARLEQEAALIAKLNDAIKRESLSELNAVYSECVMQGMEAHYASELNHAKEVKVDLLSKEGAKEEERKKREEEEERQRKEMEAKRSEQIAKLKTALTSAIASKDVNKINNALQQAITAGISIPEVDEARAVLESLKKAEQLKSQFAAIIKLLQVKAETGLVESDLQPLIAAIDEVGADSADKQVKDAVAKLDLYKRHVQAKADLEEAIAAKEASKLRAAFNAAQDLDMQIDVVIKAKRVLRDLEGTIKVVKTKSNQPLSAEARLARQEEAKQARYELKNFPQLRSADDYARGVLLNKAKIKQQFLTHQATIIPKSITEMDKPENNILAIQVHKALLGYMGDKILPFPAMLAQDILRKGFENKELRDEIYVQILKQLTGNPKGDSVSKGWQMLCMAVSTFPPSSEFENFLLHFVLEKRSRGRGEIIECAKFCLRTLEATLQSGEGDGCILSVDEILAYKERLPVLATIFLVDGTVVTEDFPIPPDLNVGKIVEMCLGWLDIKDQRADTLGMFMYDLGPTEDSLEDDDDKPAHNDLKRTPRPLRNDEHMGILALRKHRQHRKFKFVLKRKVYMPKHNKRGKDPVFERITYLQAEDESLIQGNLDLKNAAEVGQLAAISMAVAFGDEMASNVDDLVNGSTPVLDFIPPDWRAKKTAEEWAEEVLQHRDGLVNQDPDDLQEKFLGILQKNKMYGSHWFFVKRNDPAKPDTLPQAVQDFPSDLLLAFNSAGLHVFDTSKRQLITLPYADIAKWGGNQTQFSLVMYHDGSDDTYDLVFSTAQAADMSTIVADYFRFLVAELEN